VKRTIVFLLLASCAGNNGHIGCWNTVSTKTNGGIERRTNHKATFCFYDDGSMEIKGDIERTGTYECSDNGKMIVITYSNGGGGSVYRY
jgi:hypothetical protein